MRMHTTPLHVNAQGSHEARQQGARSLQMPAARPVRLVYVGTKINGKLALQIAADLPRHRRPYLVLDIQPEPARLTATYGGVLDLASNDDPQPNHNTVDTPSGQPDLPCSTNLGASTPCLLMALVAFVLGLERLSDEEDEGSQLDEDDLIDVRCALGSEPDPNYIAHCIEEEEGGWLCDGKRCDEGDADERETEEEYWARVALDDLRDLGRPSKLDDRDL